MTRGMFGSGYDTKLNAADEARFREWAGARIADTEDYDLRGAWQANAQQSRNDHLPDTYKKPNHPTFSTESQYSTPVQMGGRWLQNPDGSWFFWASPTNLKHHGWEELVRYFHEREPGNTMVAPIPFDLRNLGR